jgi:hypothetical protein
VEFIFRLDNGVSPLLQIIAGNPAKARTPAWQ